MATSTTNGNGAAADAAPGAAAVTFEEANGADTPASAFVGSLIQHARQLGASDVFFASEETSVRVTMRVMGMIRPLHSLSLQEGIRCLAYLRTMSNIKLDERRRALDGRWSFPTTSDQGLDLRVSTIPTLYGESMALRFLESESPLRDIDALGFVGAQLEQLKALLVHPGGLILVTGPTGSGKTTTLYACLHYLNDGRRKIHTLEDPIEYAVRGLNQTQITPHEGADFPSMLKGVLRQSPDVIMVGEVRDRDTAETAVRAANSGQLVLATLHAPVAASAVASMLSLGVHPFFLATSLLGVVGQRLMRKLSPVSREPLDLSFAPQTFDEVREWLKPGQATCAYAANPAARHEGYTGRTGIFELMVSNSTIRRLIAEGRRAGEIAVQATSDGMIDFHRAALLKVAEGITSFDEMQRVVPRSDEFTQD